MKVTICLFILFIHKIHSYNIDDNKSCIAQSIFDYQNTKVDWRDNKQELWKWLNYQQKTDIKTKSFCKHDSEYTVTDKLPKSGTQRGYPFIKYKCEEDSLTNVKLEYQFDKYMLPKGFGHVYRLSKPQLSTQGFTQLILEMMKIYTQPSNILQF